MLSSQIAADNQRKAERRARNKEDPYYLGDKDEIDVDDIPIVKLDDLALTDGKSNSLLIY